MSQCQPCKYQDHGNCAGQTDPLGIGSSFMDGLLSGAGIGGSTSCECRDASPDLHRTLASLGGER